MAQSRYQGKDEKMDKKKRYRILPVLISFIVIITHAVASFADDVPRITKEAVKEQLDNPDVTILDVRKGKSWDDSLHKIKSAIREDSKKYKKWAAKYPKDKTLILYCS